VSYHTTELDKADTGGKVSFARELPCDQLYQRQKEGVTIESFCQILPIMMTRSLEGTV